MFQLFCRFCGGNGGPGYALIVQLSQLFCRFCCH